MTTYTFYKPDGQITCQIDCAESDLPLQLEANGSLYVEGFFSNLAYYLPGGVPTSLQGINPSIAGNIWTGLPVPCTVYIDGNVYEVTDGVIDFQPDLPGPYHIRIVAVGYHDFNGVIG